MFRFFAAVFFLLFVPMSRGKSIDPGHKPPPVETTDSCDEGTDPTACQETPRPPPVCYWSPFGEVCCSDC